MKSFVAADDLYCGLLRVISRLGDVSILCPNTHHIVSGSQDRTIRIWSVSVLRVLVDRSRAQCKIPKL